MSLFEELDVAGADDNPWAIPDSTYACVVSDLDVKSNNGKMGMTFKYKVMDGQYSGREVTEYKRVPHSSDEVQMSPEDKAKAVSYIKQRLASLGIPEERMNGVSKDDLIGIECYVATKMNGDFINVRTVTLSAPAGATVGGPAKDNPFAV